MTRKHRTFGASFKARVALAAVRGDKTTAQLAGKFGVHGNQVSSWKKRLLEGATELFAARRDKKLIGRVKLDSSISSSPVAANGVLYIATLRRLWAVQARRPLTNDEAAIEN